VITIARYRLQVYDSGTQARIVQDDLDGIDYLDALMDLLRFYVVRASDYQKQVEATLDEIQGVISNRRGT
jgi:hypothetical protein